MLCGIKYPDMLPYAAKKDPETDPRPFKEKKRG